jgi:hypothetical protein
MNNSYKYLLISVLIGRFYGCSGYHHRSLNIHGIYEYEDLSRPVRKNYVGANVATRSWTLFETTECDPNFGRPVRGVNRCQGHRR